MADYAYGDGRDRDRLRGIGYEAAVAAMRDQPAACLIAWFLDELESFAIRHLRRDYIVQHEVLDGRIRGRLLAGEYFQRSVTRGQPQLAPCQFFEFTRDNLANQILKASLRELGRLAALVPLPEARRHLRSRVDRLVPYFGAVSDQRIDPSDFNRLRLRGALRHYAPIIRKCRALLRHAYMTTTLGPHVQGAFLWNMPQLFEDALGGVLRTTPAVSVLGWKSTATVQRQDGAGAVRKTAVVPDFVLQSGDQRLVLDAKYKETGVVGGAEDAALELDLPSGRLRIQRSDVYQAVAYGRHLAFMPCRVALVYPVARAADEGFPTKHRVTGFADDVTILFFDAGEAAHKSVDEFRQQLLTAFASLPSTLSAAA